MDYYIKKPQKRFF